MVLLLSHRPPATDDATRHHRGEQKDHSMVTVISRKMTSNERANAPWPFMWWKASARDGCSVVVAHGPTRRAAENGAVMKLKRLQQVKATTRVTTR